jgi:hypothetical protein
MMTRSTYRFRFFYCLLLINIVFFPFIVRASALDVKPIALQKGVILEQKNMAGKKMPDPPPGPPAPSPDPKIGKDRTIIPQVPDPPPPPKGDDHTVPESTTLSPAASTGR